MPSAARVLGCYLDGVDALVRLGPPPDAPEWTATACGAWSATDVAGHVLVVARWYHEWLDRAEAGDAEPPFSATELPTRNQRALAGLEPPDGPGRLAAFRERATAYAERLPDAWELPYGFPFGTVTAGEHAALAAMEWHAHAWDLARATGRDHRPVDAEGLYEAVARAWPKRQGRVRGTASRLTLPAIGRIVRDPWPLLLRSSGRRA